MSLIDWESGKTKWSGIFVSALKKVLSRYPFPYLALAPSLSNALTIRSPPTVWAVTRYKSRFIPTLASMIQHWPSWMGACIFCWHISVHNCR